MCLLTTSQASRLSSSTARTSEARVAMEITYAEMLSGPTSAATFSVSITCSQTSSILLLSLAHVTLLESVRMSLWLHFPNHARM